MPLRSACRATEPSGSRRMSSSPVTRRRPSGSQSIGLYLMARTEGPVHYGARMPTEIDVDEVQRLVVDEDAALIEVLPEREFAEEHLPGARNIPLKQLTAEAVADLDRLRPVIAYCHDDL